MSEQKTEFRPRDRWLMFALWGGPLAVLSNLNVNYALVAEACDRGTKTMLHLFTLAFVLVALVCAAIGHRYYKECERSEEMLWRERTRWLALVATVMSLASVVVLIAMEIPNVLLRSCD